VFTVEKHLGSTKVPNFNVLRQYTPYAALGGKVKPSGRIS